MENNCSKFLDLTNEIQEKFGDLSSFLEHFMGVLRRSPYKLEKTVDKKYRSLRAKWEYRLEVESIERTLADKILVTEKFYFQKSKYVKDSLGRDKRSLCYTKQRNRDNPSEESQEYIHFLTNRVQEWTSLLKIMEDLRTTINVRISASKHTKAGIRLKNIRVIKSAKNRQVIDNAGVFLGTPRWQQIDK